MKKVLLGLTVVLVFMSCKKEIDELPEPTQTGANTFGAKINDKLWGPLGFGIVQTAPILEARFDGTSLLVINARNFGSSPKESEMEIYLKDVNGPGTYLLNQNTSAHPNASANYIYYVERKITPTNEWITSAKYNGIVTITKLDVANKIVAGTFEFNSMSMGMNAQPLKVTDGRFDIKLVY